ncbi:MAG TPA: DUF2321 domain-containing protein [Longimicrobium sp.]|uniref:DUF2321 domain-containing protein n=1 Tax=Longimicrobium sp. TaxID=2029185 RepID=UPI002EDA0EDA
MSARFCAECGEPTITQCQNCNAPIRGDYFVPGVIAVSHYSAPAFCNSCGKPFPWTLRGLEAAKELVETLDTISAEEKASLKESLDDLVRDTPRTKVAEAKYKNIMKKVGREAYDGMRSILVDIASEAVKKSLFGPGA